VTGATANGDGLLDLEAASAAAASEAQKRPYTFAYKGRKYELPHLATWPMTAIDAVAVGQFRTALGEVMPVAEYDRLCADGLTLGELSFLFEQVGATQAAIPSLPNSSPSARRGSTRTSKR
jgi:hypothetical protein